jgi:hypothetical protein
MVVALPQLNDEADRLALVEEQDLPPAGGPPSLQVLDEIREERL